MVKTLLCDFCLRSGMLCSACKEKLRSGKVSPVYVEIARRFQKLEKKYPSFSRISLHKAVDIGGTVALVVGRGNIAYALSRGGKIIRKIGDEIGKDIRLFEKGSSNREFLEDLFAPYQILTKNEIWLPDGSVVTGVVLKGGRRRLKERKIEELVEVAQKLQNIALRVEFVR